MSRAKATPAARKQARVPQQLRSRKRMNSIITASNALIAKHGTLGLKMHDIATRARLPIGSVYQYFPTKSALIAHLFAQHLEVYHDLGRRYLSEVKSAAQCAAGIRRLIVEVYADNCANLLMQEIWAGVQADRAIREIHLADNAFFCDLFFNAVRQTNSPLPEKLLLRRCQIINEMWDGAIRFAITLDRSAGDALVDESIKLGLANLGLTSKP